MVRNRCKSGLVPRSSAASVRMAAGGGGLVRRSSRRSEGGFTLIEMLVVIGIIAFFILALVVLVPGIMLKARIANTSAFIQGLSVAVEQYHMRYRAFPPCRAGAGSVVTNSNKVLGQDTSRNLHLYLGTPRVEAERIDQNGVATYRIHTPLFDFKADNLQGGNPQGLTSACLGLTTPAQVIAIPGNGAVRAQCKPLIDPWDNNIYYFTWTPTDPAGAAIPATGRPDLRGGFTIESMGPPDPGSGTGTGTYTWYTGNTASHDNDIVTWKKPR